MAVSKQVEEALNEQLGHEFFSAFIYLAMAARLNDLSLRGGAHWMRMQFLEEQHHAMRFYDYLLERGGTVALNTIDAPDADWEKPLDVFKAALEHEREMTVRLNELMDLAVSAKDHATAGLLQWYVNEQVEEEATLDEIITQLEMVGGGGSGLFMIDRELGARPEPTPPPGANG